MKIVLGIVIAIVAVGFAYFRIRSAGVSGEDNARVWFYDQSEKKLYVLPIGTIPPHKGIGGASGDGVRAIVVAPVTAQRSASQRRIAYLETNSPELKRLLEEIRASRLGKLAFKGPPVTRELVQINTLVKRPDDPSWSSLISIEGHKVISEWRDWKAADGESMVVCSP